MIILRQKEFNVFTDIKYSGIKRALKKNIGWGRIKVANRLNKSLKNDLLKKQNAESAGRTISIDLHRDPETTELAKNEINRFSKENPKFKIKIENDGPYLDLNRKEINIPENISAGEFNHEIGHIKNLSGENGKIAKFINKRGQTPRTNKDIVLIDELGKEGNLSKRKRKSILSGINPKILREANEYYESPKISEAAKRFIRGRLLVQDEKNASRWGLKIIKNKLSPKTYNKEVARQNLANDGYKYAARVSSKIPIINKIQIPSRRGDFTIKEKRKIK